MKIALLGSTGFVGKVLLKRSLDEGYEIRALVRDPDKLGEFKDKIEFIQGNIFQASDLEITVKGTEAVLSVCGPPQRNPGNPKQYEQAMEDLVAALKKQKISRLITTGGAAHLGGRNEKWTIGRRLLRFFLLIVARPILVTKQLEWDVLKQSNLDWTLVRPPQITKGNPTGKVLADESNLARTKIDVADLVDFILEQISSDQWVRKAPLVASGK